MRERELLATPPPIAVASASAPAQPDASRARRLARAELMKRVFAIDVHECPRCRGPMRILAAIQPPDTTSAILGTVHWQSCLEAEGPERENIEVQRSHTGMGFHAEVLSIVADRLAQRDGSWQRYAKRA